jgi:hypothetical protein
MQTSSDLIFQAAVEAPLSLAFKNPDGAWEDRDYTVTVVAERTGLDAADVVVDFRALDAALDKALEPLRGRRLHGPGMESQTDAAKWIAEAVASSIATSIAPSIAPPARLAAVSLQDGAGRRLTLKK